MAYSKLGASFPGPQPHRPGIQEGFAAAGQGDREQQAQQFAKAQQAAEAGAGARLPAHRWKGRPENAQGKRAHELKTRRIATNPEKTLASPQAKGR